MEDTKFLLEIKFIANLLCTQTLSFLSVHSSHPLFSCIVTFSILVLLYLPRLFSKILFSPVLILSGLLLLLLLRLGAIQRSQSQQKENPVQPEPIGTNENRLEKQGSIIEAVENDSLDHVYRWVRSQSEVEFKPQTDFHSSSRFDDSFVEWNVKAPLEVIYEGEETEHDQNEVGILRYPSLSRYYPETDSDSSSESGFPATENWDSPENMRFRWDEEDREGLIEIALDGCKKREVGFQFEEENLIEIDISPTRHREFSGEDDPFSGEICCN